MADKLNTTDTAPVCSICIANYNGIHTLGDTIASIHTQKGNLPVEIIVHDDASTDQSVPFIREHHSGVRLIASKENVGFCRSNNRMVDLAAGKYILLLNNDATLFPDALSVLYDHAEHSRREAILSLPQYSAGTRKRLDYGYLLDPFLNTVPNTNPLRQEVAMVMGACLWIPRSMWNRLGGFPEWLETLAEDMYLCCKARLQGIPVRTLPRSGFYHHIGYSLGGGKITDRGLSTTIRRRALSERNRTFLMAVCYPRGALFTLFPLHLFLLVVEGLLLLFLKKSPALFRQIYVETIRALLTQRHRLGAERRNLQAARTVGPSRFFSAFHWLPHKLTMLLRHGIPELH
jgi:GT2 family glycosyltransferase